MRKSSIAASRVRSIKALRRALLLPAALLAAYLIGAAIGALLPGPRADIPASGGPPGREILLISGPIHYDFLLPLDPHTRARFAFLETAGYPLPPWAEWLVIGWGAKGFYTTVGAYSDISAAALWRGITGDAPVMHVELAGPLRDGLPLHRLSLTTAQYSALLDAIAASFARPLHRLETPGFSQTDAFFAATGRFDIFRTCNTWISHMLRTAGLPFGAWTPTPYAVTLSLRRF